MAFHSFLGTPTFIHVREVSPHGTMSASESPAETSSAEHERSLRPRKRASKEKKEDVKGSEAAIGSCHCCGGMLQRIPESARRCGTCGARYHAYDCGNRRSQAGFTNFDQCPRVSVLPPSNPAYRLVRGPCSTHNLPSRRTRTFFPGLSDPDSHPPDLLPPTLTDAFLRPDSAPRCACAREG